ncbi:MAG TPA: Rieske (2Fe-2S) protein [Myxococcaceae bacterium]|nr:Rieske (2Fe-2S) protein [Myxococcaceae bacterium]
MKVTLGPANLADGEMRNYRIGGRDVLVANVGGRYRALDDWCNHAGCLLSGGRIEGTTVVCPCHEIGFDLDTGKNLTSPDIADDQPIVRVSVVDGEIVLWELTPP